MSDDRLPSEQERAEEMMNRLPYVIQGAGGLAARWEDSDADTLANRALTVVLACERACGL